MGDHQWVWTACVAVAGIMLGANHVSFAAEPTSPASEPTSAPSAVTVTPDFAAPADPIPADFAGLSYESSLLLPQKDGRFYFGPDRETLIGIFRTLGVHSLRLGGNFSDKPSIPVPQGTTIDRVFAFAKKANVQVIYTLRLRAQTSPLDDAAVAKYITGKFADQVAYFQIGNEPDLYLKPFSAYREKLQQFAAAIDAESPGVKFCGPSATVPQWAGEWADQVGKNGPISLITQHAYFGGNGRRAEQDPAGSRDLLLSPQFTSKYEKFYDTFVPAVLKAGMQYRIEETNSFYNGGAKDVSNTFAAGLWGLDYLYWWASHGARGINFHNGDTVAAGDNVAPCWYASFTRDGDGFGVHPLGYALAAFELGSHGNLVPLQVDGDGTLTAYGVDSALQTFTITLINKRHAPPGQTIPGTVVTLKMGDRFDHGDEMTLTSPNNDVAATTGMTLGGAPITNDAGWQGNWTALNPPSQHGSFRITVPPASAMVVRLSRE